MFEILGYPDRVSHRPGERVRFMVSCEEPLEYRAELVRITSGDDSPAGPGMKETVVPGLLGQTIHGRKQISRIGSYLRVEPAPALDLLRRFHRDAAGLADAAGARPAGAHRALVGGRAARLAALDRARRRDRIPRRATASGRRGLRPRPRSWRGNGTG